MQTSPFLTHTLFTEGGLLARGGALDLGDNCLCTGAGEGEITQAAPAFDSASSREHLQVKLVVCSAGLTAVGFFLCVCVCVSGFFVVVCFVFHLFCVTR